MNRRRVVGIILLVALISAVPWLLTRGKPWVKSEPRLIGWTNGVVGPVAKRFGGKSAAAVTTTHKWLADGTNAAVFLLTNPERFPIYVSESCQFQMKGPPATDEEVPVLNARTLTLLRPGHSTTVQVAILPRTSAWRIEFVYHRADRRPFENTLDSIVESISRIPTHTKTYSTHTDWMEP